MWVLTWPTVRKTLSLCSFLDFLTVIHEEHPCKYLSARPLHMLARQQHTHLVQVMEAVAPHPARQSASQWIYQTYFYIGFWAEMYRLMSFLFTDFFHSYIYKGGETNKKQKSYKQKWKITPIIRSLFQANIWDLTEKTDSNFSVVGKVCVFVHNEEVLVGSILFYWKLAVTASFQFNSRCLLGWQQQTTNSDLERSCRG